MLELYDDGRSKGFYCLATTLLSLESLTESLLIADKEILQRSVPEGDLRGRARILRETLNQFAREEDEELKLRKAKK